MSQKWTVQQGVTENFQTFMGQASLPPVYNLRLLLAPDVPHELLSEAESAAFDAISAAVNSLKAKSEHNARRVRLEQDRTETVKRIERLKEQTASVGRNVEDAIFHGRPTDDLEQSLDGFVRELAAAEGRILILDRLIGEAKVALAKELRAAIEAARLKEVAKLDGEIKKAAEDLAGAAESLAGSFFILSEARQRLQYRDVVAERFVDVVA